MTPKIENELFEIASAVCDDSATQGQLLRLEEIMAEHVEARTVYSDLMLMHADLFWQQHAIDHFVESKSESRAGSSVFSGWSGWFAAMAATLLIGSAAGIAISRLFDSDNQETVVATLESRGEEIATVTHTINCRWSNNNGEKLSEPIGYGSAISAGQNLDLLEGLAEITFRSGVRMIIEAPARLDLASVSESVLHQGRLTASVPHGAEGFQVECPGITLIDRGTEFGVNSDENGETEVQVFEGLVDGYVNDSNGDSFKKVSWKTNDKALFNPSTKEFRDVTDPSIFVRSLSQSIANSKGVYAHEDFDYAVGPLGGLNGGTGWGGPWENISFADGVDEGNGVGAGTIPYKNLVHLGNHALLNGQFNRIRRKLSTSFSGVFDAANLVENQDGSRLIGRDGTTLYLSYIQCVSKIGDAFYGFELNRGDGNKNRVLCIGHGAARAWNEGPPRSPNKGAGITGWSVTSEFNGAPNQLMELGDLGNETDDPVLVVVRLTFGQNNSDEVAVFVNPDPTNESNPNVSGRGNFAFDRIGIANFEGDKSFQVDHIRLGVSFSSVINPHRIPVSLDSKK